jgi:hypothetical protein
MKKQSFLFFTFLFILFYTGCATKPKIEYVTVTKTRYVALPADMYKDGIELPKPPNKYDYIIASPLEREKMLVNHILDLYKTIGLYKLKLKYIKLYEINASKIYKNVNGG